jgi:hypothetical protein
MASINQVHSYLAFWFQLGKAVVLPRSGEALLPAPIFQNGTYSPQFEACWQRLQSTDAKDAYLEGTVQTVTELLTPSWDVTSCSRCAMPVPVLSLGVPPMECPCNDLPGWPNTELPSPRIAVDSRQQLQNLRDRLRQDAELTDAIAEVSAD